MLSRRRCVWWGTEIQVHVGLRTAAGIIRGRNTTRGVDASKEVAAQLGGERQDGLFLGWKRLIESFVKELGGLGVTDVVEETCVRQGQRERHVPWQLQRSEFSELTKHLQDIEHRVDVSLELVELVLRSCSSPDRPGGDHVLAGSGRPAPQVLHDSGGESGMSLRRALGRSIPGSMSAAAP